jgi:hypothetical protein
MTDAKVVVADAANALGISYQIVMNEKLGRSIVFQAHVAVDTPLHQLNELFDRMDQSATRQVHIQELALAYRALADHELQLKGVMVQRELLDATAREAYEQEGRKGDWSPAKLSAQQRQARLATEQSIEKWKGGFEHYKTEIARLEGLVGPDAPDSSADRNSG